MSSDVARWPDDFPAVAGYRRCSHTVRPGVSMTDVFALESEVDSSELRRVLGKFTTGVVIVTTMTENGPIGMTVNSFCSVSLTPPVVLFCVRHGSQLHPPFASATAFAVNILDE